MATTTAVEKAIDKLFRRFPMPDHLRKQIRDDLKVTMTGLTTTGSKIFSARTTELTAGTDYPALLIDTFEEDSVTDTIDPPRGQARTLKFKILAVDEHSPGFEDTLDMIAKEVEDAMTDDTTINGLAKDARLTSTSLKLKLDPDHDHDLLAIGTQNVGILTMVWTIDYRIIEDDPTKAA